MWVSFYLGNHCSPSLSSLKITGLYLCMKSLPKLPSTMIVFVNITKPRVTWEKNLSEELPTLGWLVAMSMGHCLKWTDVGRSCPLQAASFPKRVILDCSRVRKLIHTQAGRHACISPCSIVGVMSPATSCPVTVASPEWWMEFRLCPVINPFPTQLLIARVTYHSNGNRSGTHRKSHSCFLRFLYFLLLLERPAY